MQRRTGNPWSEPALIALMRTRPEEAVLAACKRNIFGPPPGPQGTNNVCTQPDVSGCPPCSLQTST